MRIAVYSTKPYDREFFEKANADGRHELTFFESRLNIYSSKIAEGFPVVCTFVNDDLSKNVLERLFAGGTRFLALRCAGFNNVDLQYCRQVGMKAGRVPAYSPHSVAEHTIGMMLTLSRKIHRAYNRTREGNFALEGLLGFDLFGKTAGVVGTGKIGAVTAKILLGIGCRVIANDQYENDELKKLGVSYVSRDDLFRHSDIITLHCPLMPETCHLVNEQTLALTKPGVMLINTSRGGLVETDAVIAALKSERIGALGLDVYEEEGGFFYEDYSDRLILDDDLARLLTFPNVLVTGHQAFFTREALTAIAETSLANVSAFEENKPIPGEIHWEMVQPKPTA